MAVDTDKYFLFIKFFYVFKSKSVCEDQCDYEVSAADWGCGSTEE